MSVESVVRAAAAGFLLGGPGHSRGVSHLRRAVCCLCCSCGFAVLATRLPSHSCLDVCAQTTHVTASSVSQLMCV